MHTENMIVFDIETIGIYNMYSELPEEMQTNWELKTERYYPEYKGRLEDVWKKCSGINPEYSRICCISLGAWSVKAEEFKTKSFAPDSFLALNDETEKQMILDFFAVLEKLIDSGKYGKIAGHNIKNFDVAFICKRAVCLGISYDEFPKIFQIRGLKPWEMAYILDTKELYSFGSFMFKSSLSEICNAMGIETPKGGDVEGRNLHDYLHQNKGPFEKVIEYCEKDVIATYEVLKRL